MVGEFLLLMHTGFLVPNGSTIIFCFGEIDCRDGLTTAVAMCKYEVRSLE